MVIKKILEKDLREQVTYLFYIYILFLKFGSPNSLLSGELDHCDALPSCSISRCKPVSFAVYLGPGFSHVDGSFVDGGDCAV